MREVVCPNCGQIARNNRDTCALCGASLKPVRRRGRGLLAALLILVLLAGCAGAYVWLNGSPLPLLDNLLDREPLITPAQEEIVVEPAAVEEAQPAQSAPAPAETAVEPTPVPEPTPQPIPASAWTGVEKIYAGPGYSLGLRADGTVLIAGSAPGGVSLDVSDWTDVTELCPAAAFVAGLRRDGTVLVTGDLRGLEDVGSWTDVTRLFTDGEEILAALCADGSVLAGSPDFYSVSDWRDVKDLALGRSLILGLTADGRVLAAGDTASARGVERWINIRQIAAGEESCFGLTVDGTVISDDRYNENEENQMGRDPVYSWKGVDRLLTVGYHPVGVDSLGYLRLYQQAYADQAARPVYTGQKALVIPDTGTTLILDREGRVGIYDGSGLFDPELIRNWSSVTDIVCGCGSAAALCADGTVLVLQNPEDAIYDVSGWTDIVALAMGDRHLLGLRSDGTVLAAGDNTLEQCALR